MTYHWQHERQADWERMEALLKSSRLHVEHLKLSEVKELTRLYRGLVNDLAKAQSLEPYAHLTPYLNSLAQRAHARLNEAPGVRLTDIIRYFWCDFPRCVRRNKWFILAGFMAFLAGTVVSMTLVWMEPTKARYFLPIEVLDNLAQGKVWVDNMSAAPNEATFLMTNNIRVAFMAYGAGVLLGIGTLLIMFSNGMNGFGGPLQACINADVGHKLILFMIPHGVIELSTIFFAGAAGMMLGYAMLFPGPYSRWQAMLNRGKDSMILIAGCVPMLIIAGLIEGLVSLNGSLPDWFRIAFSALTAALLGLYLYFGGRTPDDSPNASSRQAKTSP